ncbi:MAG: AAA family ATPase [Phycicoccus sp.]|nr:AAA family ATPase [Phycicoccus sp.]
MPIEFSSPACSTVDEVHHARAASGNAAVADEAIGVLRDALSGAAPVDRILLKAAAGAGKSFVLKRLVADAIEHPRCRRIAVVAFTNNQIHPLAASLGATLGADRVCLFVSKHRYGDVPDEAHANATVVTTTSAIPLDCDVVISTSHKLGAISELKRQMDHFGPGHNGASPFDVLFVDEAWQLPHHLFDKVAKAAPIAVGVGDVGQLPPLEIGANPWRGDPGFNPYRAWPTDSHEDARTWSVELPAVWRPTAAHLDLWRAFYPEWDQLHCVAAPGDRALVAEGLSGIAADVWRQVGSGVPTLLEVAGLPAPEAADVDLPLMGVVESLLDELLTAGFALESAEYDDAGTPTGKSLSASPGDVHDEQLIAVLATRNQAVDDATDVVERLRTKHSLSDTDVVASTVDSWQGQTNGITVAIHPLSGAAQLDEFNSAFGRLAVTCTRATHGLLMMARPGLDQLLGEAPARPGTPFGEPGNRHLPRQTHQRILATFARGTLTIEPDDL